MLTLTRDGDAAVVLASDDRNGENILLDDAIGTAAPELATAYAETPVGDDGLLRFRVERADWLSLLDALETMEDAPDAPDVALKLSAFCEEEGLFR